jgi:hypothetical protein
MPFLEGMGDKNLSGARKHPLQGAAPFSASDAVGGPGVPDVAAPPVGAPPPSLKKGKPWQKKTPQTESRYGLPSRSEMMFPEAYQPVGHEFWEGLTDTQRNELIRLQAVAQEKVGFERGTKKFFIDDFDPDKRGPADDVSLLTMAAPRFVAGGALIGAGLTLGILGFVGTLAATPALFWAAMLALSGVALLVVSR